MTTTTNISCDGGFEAFSKWLHPNDIQAKNISKTNAAAFVANSSIIATIAALAFACFSSFAILGIILTSVAGFSYFLSADVAKVTLEKLPKPAGWTPLVIEIGTTGIGWHRCFPTAQVPAVLPADISDGSINVEADHKH